MRKLTTTEIGSVSGGIVEELYGITQIGRGLTLGSVVGAAAGAFALGWQIGTWIYGTRGYQALLMKLN